SSRADVVELEGRARRAGKVGRREVAAGDEARLVDAVVVDLKPRRASGIDAVRVYDGAGRPAIIDAVSRDGRSRVKAVDGDADRIVAGADRRQNRVRSNPDQGA